jgi:hypothetical protein
MNRKAALAFIAIGAFIGACGGWFVSEMSRVRDCPIEPNVYAHLDVSLDALAEYPLNDVPNDAVGQVQRCWAAHPFGGPQHVLHLTDARQAPSGDRYLIFDPWGISDLQMVYSVDAKNRLTRAYTSRPDR